MILKFYSQNEIVETGVISTKIEGFKNTRQLPVNVESKVKFTDCPAVRQAGIDPTVSYKLSELTEANRKLYFNTTSNEEYVKDIVLYDSEDRDLVNKALSFTRGLKPYDDYFGKGNVANELLSQFSLAFSAHGAANDIGDGFINFKDKNLNNVPATFERLSESG